MKKMDAIFGKHEVQWEDLEEFNFSVPALGATNTRKRWMGKCWRVESRSGLWETYHQQQAASQAGQGQAADDWLKTTEASEEDTDQWREWLGSQSLLNSSSTPADGSLQEDRLAIVATSPVHLASFDKLVDGPTALRYSPVQRDCLFAIAQHLFIHPTYFSLIEEGSPCAVRIDLTANKRNPCHVYLLRTSNNVERQSAIAITHFPSSQVVDQNGNTVRIGARTNALISGYDQRDLNNFKSHFKHLKHFPSDPTRLVASFLEVEKEKRFHDVRRAVRNMQTVIHELTKESLEAPSARRKLNETVDFYFVVHHLRTDGLVSWRDQLKLLRGQLDTAEHRDMVLYLDQQVSRYDHRIGRCDMVLQGASLACQMETTQLSRKDTEIAIGDGKTMKAIAVLTMIFLPGTFIATMLAVPQIEDALKPENDSSFGDRKWLWYIVLTFPVTIVALAAYGLWEYLYKRRYIKALFGVKAGNEKDEDVELALVSRRSSLSSSS